MSKRTTQRDINASERSRLALSLRRMGVTLDDIAKQCGYADKSGAFRAIKRELERLPVEDAVNLRKLELLRLDHLETVCYKRMTAQENKDPLWAVDRLIAISESRRKLLNLDVTPDVEAAQQSYTKRIILTHQSSASGGTNDSSLS